MYSPEGVRFEGTLILMSQPSDGSRVSAFDGLRAVAILAVLVQHNFAVPANPVTSLGPIGVRLFFVLSGFLITGILITSRQAAEVTGTPMRYVWRAFLMRRALRIFPLAYLALLIAWLCGAPAMTQYGVWYWLYVGNIASWLYGEVAFAGLQYWWSLAIEEQFYVLWPAVILLLPRRAWQPLTLALLVVAAVARVLHFSAEDIGPAYVLTWCRMDALAFGALLAMRRIDGALLLVVGANLFGFGTLLGETAPGYTLREIAFVILSGAVVVSLSQGAMRTILSWRPLVALGSISYGVYVWAGLVQALLLPSVANAIGVAFLTSQFGWGPFLINATTTLVLSVVSWRYLERPLNNLKRHWPYVPSHPSHAARHSNDAGAGDRGCAVGAPVVVTSLSA
jgi:peptidoglycan/LPS O-acetylase OafA/YrhL